MWGNVKSFTWHFWLLNFVIFASYSTFVPFFANISMLLRFGFGFSLIEAGYMMAIPSFIVTLFCPLIGYISDLISLRGAMLTLAAFFSLSTQVYIAYLPAELK